MYVCIYERGGQLGLIYRMYLSVEVEWGSCGRLCKGERPGCGNHHGASMQDRVQASKSNRLVRKNRVTLMG